MAKPLDVLLVHHHTRSTIRPIMAFTVGLVSLADYLERGGVRAEVVHLGIEERLDPTFDVLDYLAASGARILGLSVHWFFQLPDSLELARRVKSLRPDVLVVIGGFTASLYGRQILEEHRCIDAIVRGDGEVPFAALCAEHLARGGRSFEAVPNLLYRDAEGALRETPFGPPMTPELFATLRPTNLRLLKNYEAYRSMPFSLSRRFRERFDASRKGWICLAPTRGCGYSCPLCGGGRDAQKIAFNRTRLLFQPPAAVLDNIREAMDHGCQCFYLCSDPAPDSDYYPELFRHIREAKLRLTFFFECWTLPSTRFIDAFRDTFEDGLLGISPDSADEEIRRRTKGPLAFSNADLLSRLRYIWDRDLPTHLFFGYFLPGDTPETVARTRRFAHELETDLSEVFYLAFSTDPGSAVNLAPEKHDMALKVRTLGEYLDALPRDRVSSNLIAHRPQAMSDEQASDLALYVTLDQHVHKVFPSAKRMLRLVAGDADAFQALEEGLLWALVADAKQRGGTMPDTATLLAVAQRSLGEAGGLAGAGGALADVLRYDATPYALMDAHFGGLGRHYAYTCDPLPLQGEARDGFRRQAGAVTSRQTFDFDVPALLDQLRDGRLGDVSPRPTVLDFVIDRRAGFIVDRVG